MSTVSSNVRVGSSLVEGSGEQGDTNVHKALEGVVSELIAQWGLECFTLDLEPPVFEPPAFDPAFKSGTFKAQPSAIPVAPPSEPKERDFWDDVALLSNGSIALPPNALGAKPDLAAYAIALVSARYTLASAESKPAVPLALHNGTALAPRAPLSPPSAGASGVAEKDKRSGLEACDLVTVLESFLEFEQDAGLSGVEALDSAVFELARQRAGAAVAAANVIKNSALKAAEGRRG